MCPSSNVPVIQDDFNLLTTISTEEIFEGLYR